MLIGVLLLGIFSGASINNIAAAPLSLIAADFDTTPSNITLVASASGLALACTMPVAGWLSVQLGSRRILTLAYSLLLVGCLLAGLAPSVWMLIVARVLQGLAMSVIPPTVMYVLPMIAGSARRARALGWWAVANGAGTASGAPLGAFIADAFGWRMMFLVFVPVCALLALGCRRLPPDSDGSRPLDAVGAAMITSALLFLLAPALISGAGTRPVVQLSLLAIGVASTILFVRRMATAREPLVDPAFLRSRGFLVGTVSGSCQMFTLGTVSVLVPLLLLDQGASIRVAGLFVLMVTLVMMAAAPIVSSLVPRIGAGPIMVVGLWLLCVSIAVCALLFQQEHTGLTAAPLLAIGVALGCLQSPSAIVVSEEKSSRGSGVGLYNSLRFGAGVLGISWLSLSSAWGLSDSEALMVAAVPIAAGGLVVTAKFVARGD